MIPKHTLLLQDLAIAGYVAKGKYVWKKSLNKTLHEGSYETVVCSATSGMTASMNVYCADSYTVDMETGIFTLVSPTMVSLNYYYTENNMGSLTPSQLAGKYFIPAISASQEKSAKTIYYGHPTSISAGAKMSDGLYCTTCKAKALSVNDRVFIDFVVSDNSAAYPDGGVKNGYWYEKIKELTAEMFGCTEIAIDKFTFSTRTKGNTAISHSLGKVPRFYFVASDNHSSADYDIYNTAGMCGWNGSSNVAYGGVEFSYSSATRAASGGDLSTDSVIRLSSSSSYFTAGVEYTLITMA